MRWRALRETRFTSMRASTESSARKAEAFINTAARAIKKGMQDVAAVLGVNIGFLFQKQAAFEAGVATLQASDHALADYLRQARAVWSELLQDARNAVEHEGWTLPAVRYARTGR